MLRVPQQHPGHKQRGRGCCAISERPTPLLFAVPSLFRMLSPIIPVHPRNAPVSPIIPAHTQKQGVGVGNTMVTYLKYVGAPTILEWPASEGVWCHDILYSRCQDILYTFG